MSLAVLRDLAIIALAVETLLLGLVLAVLVWQVWSLVRMLREELTPIMESANETANTVRGTAVILSRYVVNPLVRTVSYGSAVNRFLRVLRRDRRQPATDAESSEAGD